MTNSIPSVTYVYCPNCGHEYEVQTMPTGVTYADGFLPEDKDEEGLYFYVEHREGCETGLYLPRF